MKGRREYIPQHPKQEDPQVKKLRASLMDISVRVQEPCSEVLVRCDDSVELLALETSLRSALEDCRLIDESRSTSCKDTLMWNADLEMTNGSVIRLRLSSLGMRALAKDIRKYNNQKAITAEALEKEADRISV